MSVIPNTAEQTPYIRHSHAAVFVEVRVDRDLGTTEVSRLRLGRGPRMKVVSFNSFVVLRASRPDGPAASNSRLA